MKNALNWFEIPVADFDRAVKFYGAILETQLYCSEMNGSKMAFFPQEDKGVGGALIFGDGYTPSSDGAVVYLNAGDDLSDILSRVEPNGGKILIPKMQITAEIGSIAVFLDTEGGKVALHSQH
ncbi:MAG: VOC family protein [Bacteroidetes bacterium]|nr:VOC family protein [Bacteroidota bacterium]